MNKKAKAEKFYKSSLKRMVRLVGNSTTYDNDLEKTGKKLFGSLFVGIFSSDEIPDINKNEMLIANLDKHNEAGSHWVGIIKDKNDIIWVYDSFGRNLHKILPSIYGKGKTIKSTEQDAEQNKKENNCGARCLAFLNIFHKLGIEYAKYV